MDNGLSRSVIASYELVWSRQTAPITSLSPMDTSEEKGSGRIELVLAKEMRTHECAHTTWKGLTTDDDAAEKEDA